MARKYGVDFVVKKDISESPAKWLVFFKAKDADCPTSAFKEFTAREATQKRNAGKPSVIENVRRLAAKVKNQVVEKVKNKGRGGHTR